MDRPFIPEVRKASITGDYRKIALSLCSCFNDPPFFLEPKYVPFGWSFARDKYYTFDGRPLLSDDSAAVYVHDYSAENNLVVSDFLLDVPGYPTDYKIPIRSFTVKRWLELEIDCYDIIPSYEQAFKDIFNIKYNKDEELRTQNLDKYVHVMRCVEPNNLNVIFNVVSTAELSNLVKSYAEMLDTENKMTLYFDE